MNLRCLSKFGALVPVVAGLCLAPTSAVAQPHPGKGPPASADDKRDEARDKRDEARDKRDEARDKRDEARDALKEGDVAEARKKAQALLDARKDLVKARNDARKAAREAIKARLQRAGATIPPAALRAELQRNARRIARLVRAREVAETAKDTAAVERIDKLLAKENARHERWMDRHATPAPAASGGVQ